MPAVEVLELVTVGGPTCRSNVKDGIEVALTVRVCLYAKYPRSSRCNFCD